MKRLIAMRCTREQFDTLGIELSRKQNRDFAHYNYLHNTEHGIFYMDVLHDSREIHETFNKDIFLEACGLLPLLKITKETAIKYNMKDEFPELFEVELKVGEWYKTKSNCLFNLNEITDNFYLGYGFTESMTYYSEFREYIPTELKPATHEEVFEALINEAVKIGFEEGVLIEDIYTLDKDPEPVIICSDIFYYEEVPCPPLAGKMALRDEQGHVVFCNGKWAQIIPTYTKKEAEEKFNIKIV